MVRFGLSVPITGGGDPVALARRAEALGFSFVSMSDHPALAEPVYETWTMASWILASTTRLRVATRVLGVPFRSPALLAKMAATQAQLSGGRLVLGLGAGAADAELRAYGLPVPSPGEKVAGLADAIAIARGLWSVPSFSHGGSRHSVVAASLEPKPAAPIPIWLGTFGPRALRLTGRTADGWIPSYGYAPPSAIPGMRALIDEGAAEAGRDPSSVEFVYHLTLGPDADLAGTPAQLADKLTELARSLDVAAFSLAPLGLPVEALAAEVLPAVAAALPD